MSAVQIMRSSHYHPDYWSASTGVIPDHNRALGAAISEGHTRCSASIIVGAMHADTRLPPIAAPFSRIFVTLPTTS